MKDVPQLARWMFPSTISTLETKIESLKEENYKLKRKNASLRKKISKDAFLYPYWDIFDWERVYVPTDDET